ncbi:MAG: TolC family protein [Bdellovibrio sp.]
MKHLIVIALLNIILVEVSFAESPKEITLSEKSVKELVLKQGPRALEVNLRYQQFRLDDVRTLSAYDWNISAESGYEDDKSAGLFSTGTTVFPHYKRYRTTMSLQKPFTTGTLLGIEVNSLSQNLDTSIFPSNPPPSAQNLDSAGIALEQAIWGNFFGVADRATVNAADLAYQANMISRANDLEDVVLEAVREFWNTYVAQETNKEAVNSRERYKTLVNAVKRKTSLGYTNPGDLPQVQAEYETRDQRVRTTTLDYKKSVENLITLLALEPNTKINFEIPDMIPSVPQLSPVKPESLRTIRAQKLRLESAQQSLDAAESLQYPTLKLVGRAYTSGYGPGAGDAFSGVTSDKNPKYYLGLKFQYYFGSGLQKETVSNRRISKNLEDTRLQRQLMETEDFLIQSERQAQTAFEITLSAKRQRDFREKASKELNRSYSQGRTDISILITSMNNFFDSEVQYFRALGDYAIALNQWVAARDELVTDNGAVK